jgi:hypothetical protein
LRASSDLSRAVADLPAEVFDLQPEVSDLQPALTEPPGVTHQHDWQDPTWVCHYRTL